MEISSLEKNSQFSSKQSSQEEGDSNFGTLSPQRENLLIPLQENSSNQNRTKKIDSLDIDRFYPPQMFPRSANSSLLANLESPLGKKKINPLTWNNLELRLNQAREEKTADDGELRIGMFFQNGSNDQKKLIKVDEIDFFKTKNGKKNSQKNENLSLIQEVDSNSFNYTENDRNGGLSGEESDQNDNELTGSLEGALQNGNFEPRFSEENSSEEEEKFQEDDDESEEEDGEISIFEGSVDFNIFGDSPNDSPNFESSIELDILMNGLNGINNIDQGQESHRDSQDGLIIERSFNCCFSLFTSKQLESDTEERNIENRQNVEFYKFTEKYQKSMKTLSLQEIGKVDKNNSFTSLRSLSSEKKKKQDCQEKEICYEDGILDLKKVGKVENKCLICRDALCKGVFITCYELCGHFFHEECIVDTVMKKWVENGSGNNLHLACPKCVGIRRWREIFYEL